MSKCKKLSIQNIQGHILFATNTHSQNFVFKILLVKETKKILLSIVHKEKAKLFSNACIDKNLNTYRRHKNTQLTVGGG